MLIHKLIPVLLLAAACNQPAGGTAQAAAPASASPACPRAYADLPGAASPDEKTCSCPAGTPSGNLWGVDVYTQDSSPCMAAVHAGIIQASSGGTIKVKPAAGCSSYEGSARNGVKSSSWASYPTSFYFPSKGEPRCAGAAAPVAAAPVAACPASFGQIKDVGPATEITCSCASVTGGSVWGGGGGVYTQDSSLCQAAVHAGAIPAGGGKITARAAPGCPAYTGSVQNGVTTSSWATFPASFYFPSRGEGRCAGPAAAPAPVAACPASFGQIAGLSPATEITCECGPTNLRGSVWGSGPYTQDSSICNAALHAGLVTAQGGPVTAKAGPGCASYASSNAAGVTTNAWGAFPSSFDFPAKGSRGCAP